MIENCRICGSATVAAGEVTGQFHRSIFYLRHCEVCRFSFVANPLTNLHEIYSEAYYRGAGADDTVDYLFELTDPLDTVRVSEWEGIRRVVSSMTAVDPAVKWLDFGCGNGGLVRYVKQHTPCEIAGFEEGWIVKPARDLGIPILEKDQLESSGPYDIVTAIEVLEHVEDPLAVLRLIRRLLKPGGLFFLTTGNAAPYRGRLALWRYVRPEIHISFFEPETLKRAFLDCGLEPESRSFPRGYEDIIRFKILKNLGIRRRAFWQDFVPWGPVAQLVDRRFQLSRHPVGWAR